jgi:hypothetical protein
VQGEAQVAGVAIPPAGLLACAHPSRVERSRRVGEHVYMRYCSCARRIGGRWTVPPGPAPARNGRRSDEAVTARPQRRHIDVPDEAREDTARCHEADQSGNRPAGGRHGAERQAPGAAGNPSANGEDHPSFVHGLTAVGDGPSANVLR